MSTHPVQASVRAWAISITLAGVLVATLAGCSGVSAGSGGAGTGSGGAGTARCTHRQKMVSDTVALVTGTCPAKVGASTPVTITIRDSAGHPVTDAAVSMHSIMPSMNMSGANVTALPHGDGYRANVLLGMSGTWLLEVTVVLPGANPAHLQFSVPGS